MKKILCTLAVVGLAASAFAQGTVAFGPNNAQSLVQYKATTDGTAAPIPVGGGFVQMLWAPAGTAAGNYTGGSLTSWLAANPGWNKVDATIKAIGPAPGRWTAVTVTLPTATPGALVDAAVAAWQGTAASFDAAVTANSPVGISGKFSVDTGNPNATPIPDLPGSTGAFTGITAVPGAVAVPEPSSLALFGLGAAALMIFRRK